MKKQIFNFKKQIGWSEVMASAAIIISVFSLYLQYISNTPDISLTNEIGVITNFTDRDNTERFFGFYRGTICNNGNKSITLLGLKPNKSLGLFITTEEGSANPKNGGLPYKIFQISDTVMIHKLFTNQKNLWDFDNQGLEKLSMLNKTIGPGEAFTLNVGMVLDLYSDTTKHYESVILTAQLSFSNGQLLNFGGGNQISD